MSTGTQGSQSQPVLRAGFAAGAASPATETQDNKAGVGAPAFPVGPQESKQLTQEIADPKTVAAAGESLVNPLTPQQPTGVLRSGEKQASTMQALSNPNSRTYYHRVPGAKFIMPNGLELQFLGGRLITDDVDIIAELDKIKDKSTSMIFTQKAGIGAVTAQENAAAEGAAHTDGIDGKQG